MWTCNNKSVASIAEVERNVRNDVQLLKRAVLQVVIVPVLMCG